MITQEQLKDITKRVSKLKSYLDIDKKLTGQPMHYDDKIITHCKNLDSLIQDIEISHKKIITPKDIESFFQKYLGYSKIKPSVKISDIILSFIK